MEDMRMKYSLRVQFCYLIICAYCHLVQSDTSHAHTDLLLIRMYVNEISRRRSILTNKDCVVLYTWWQRGDISLSFDSKHQKHKLQYEIKLCAQ